MESLDKRKETSGNSPFNHHSEPQTRHSSHLMGLCRKKMMSMSLRIVAKFNLLHCRYHHPKHLRKHQAMEDEQLVTMKPWRIEPVAMRVNDLRSVGTDEGTRDLH
jgi:hypothetical protein